MFCPNCGKEMQGNRCEACGYTDTPQQKKHGNIGRTNTRICIFEIIQTACTAPEPALRTKNPLDTSQK